MPLVTICISTRYKWGNKVNNIVEQSYNKIVEQSY